MGIIYKEKLGINLCMIVLLLIPYNIIGIGLGNLILIFLPLLYLIFTKVIINDKKIIIIAIIFFIYAILVSMIRGIELNELVGLSCYLAYFLYYIFFNSLLDNQVKKDYFKNIFLNGIVAVAIIYLVFEGLILNVNRVSGNTGYANSFALIMLFGIYLNIISNYKYKDYIETILIMTIIFTGSRATILYLIILNFVRLIKRKDRDIGEIGRNISISLIGYIFIKKYKVIFILILPLVIYFWKYIYTKVNVKVLRVYSFLLLLIGVSINSNTIERLKNISVYNGAFQERIIAFEDVIRAIKYNVFGYGINSYSYSESVRTAYYTGEYVHNSFLQIIWEIGILGGILFVFLILTIGIKIYKKEKLDLSLIMYIIIILHSLLDFDLSFVSIIAIIPLMLVLNEQTTLEDKKSKKNKICKCLNTLFIVLVGLTIILEGTLSIARIQLNNGRYQSVKELLSLYPFQENWEVSQLLGQAIYNNNEDKRNLEEAEKYILKSIKRNSENYNSKRILLQIYDRLGKKEEFISLGDRILEEVKYYKEDYKYYYKTIEKYYKENKNEKCKEKLDEIKVKYSKAKENINKRSKYIKNQII